MTQNTYHQLKSYIINGSLATIVHFIVLTLLVELLNMSPIYATTIAFFLGAITGFSLNKKFTFKTSTTLVHIKIIKYLIITCMGAALNSMLLSGLISTFALHYIFSQGIATGLIIVFNFCGYKYWVFSKG